MTTDERQLIDDVIKAMNEGLLDDLLCGLSNWCDSQSRIKPLEKKKYRALAGVLSEVTWLLESTEEDGTNK